MTIKEQYADSIVVQHDYAKGTSKGQNGENDGAIDADVKWSNGLFGRELISEAGTGEVVAIPDADNLSFGDGGSDVAFSTMTLLNIKDASTLYVCGKGVSEWYVFSASNDKLYIRLVDSVTGGFIGQKYDTVITDLENECITIGTTYDGSGTNAGCKIYINGLLIATVDSGSGIYNAMTPSTDNLEVGSFNNVTSNGRYNECTIFRSLELSGQEMAKLHEEIMAKAIYNIPYQLHIIQADGDKHDVYIASGRGWNVSVAEEGGTENAYLSNTGWYFGESTVRAKIVDFGDNKALSTPTAGTLTRKLDQVYGTWEFDIQLTASTDFGKLLFMSDGASGWYSVWFGNDTFKLVHITNGDIITGSWTSDTDLHTIKVIRSVAGLFELFLDDVSAGTATDTTLLSSKEMLLITSNEFKVGNFNITPLNY